MSTATTVETLQILVTGVPQAGKSCLVQTIASKAAWGNQESTGWLCGRIKVDESLMLELLEPPSTTVFDFLWMRDLIAQAHVDAFIIVCDSTRPDTFGETVGLLQSVSVYHPDSVVVLLANKQDRPGAWSAEDIRVALGIPREISVIGAVANERSSVRDALLQVMVQIYD